jgi:CysZ protein
MSAFLRGLAFMSKNPRLWVYAWGPLVLTGAIYVGLLVLAQISLTPLIDRLTPENTFLDRLPLLGSIAIFVVWLIAANFIILAITSLFSGLLWGRLSQTAEKAIYGDAPDTRLGCLPQVSDMFLRMLQAAVFVVIVIAFSWLGFIVGAIASGIIGAIEFSAPAYARRGILYPAQLKVLRARGTIGFAIAAGLVSLLPLVFVLAMPAFVVGGTILCREAEGAQTLP